MTSVLETTPAILEDDSECVLLHNISWSTYESLLKDLTDVSNRRFTYDRGDLLIMVPSPEHEKTNDSIKLLITLLAEALEIEHGGFGSTTYKREDIQRGFEPDSCFYFKNEARMRGKKRLDLSIDPPPDLVVEIDVSRSSMNKLPLFAAFGIPEVWRFDGKGFTFYVLECGEYQSRENSLALPQVNPDKISSLVLDSLNMGRLEWLKKVREWLKTNLS